MATVTDVDRSRFFRDGYIVFRQLLPTSLITDLRSRTDHATALARHRHGEQAQRLQPLQQYDDELDLQPFRDFVELPQLRAALDAALSADHVPMGLSVLALFVEPATRPYCTDWHRDITLQSSGLELAEFRRLLLDWQCVNQINCPLYDDSSTWFVPGSHLREYDLPGEAEAANAVWIAPQSDAATQERLCWDYAAAMPGAVQLHLNAGDLALYRPSGWHLGNYAPHRKRATLHTVVSTPQYSEWWHAWVAGERRCYPTEPNTAVVTTGGGTPQGGM